MKKKGFFALLLVCMMCFNSSVVMAEYSYNTEHTVLGKTVVTIGQLISPTQFFASTSWGITDRTIEVSATVYTIPMGEEYEAFVGLDKSTGKKYCSIDHTYGIFANIYGTYSISSIILTHKIPDGGTPLLNYNRTLKY